MNKIKCMEAIEEEENGRKVFEFWARSGSLNNLQLSFRSCVLDPLSNLF